MVMKGNIVVLPGIVPLENYGIRNSICFLSRYIYSLIVSDCSQLLWTKSVKNDWVDLIQLPGIIRCHIFSSKGIEGLYKKLLNKTPNIIDSKKWIMDMK